MVGEESFPLVTFTLAAGMIAIFLFTSSNIQYYENLFGFVLSRPVDSSSTKAMLTSMAYKMSTLITYSFIHADITHLFFNLIFLVVGGLAVEEVLGKAVFLSVYVASANIAVVFDIVGRLISKVSFSSPFIGASGAIFGVLAIAALIKPEEKAPKFLIVPVLLAIYLILYYKNLAVPFMSWSYLDVLMMSLSFSLTLLPFFLPINMVTLVFIAYWMVAVFLNLAPGVSNVGHLGGVLGGIAAFFIFAKSKKTQVSGYKGKSD